MNLRELVKTTRASFKEAKTPASGRPAAIRDSLLTRDTYKHIYKEAYGSGMNLSRWLEKIDPSADHPQGSGDAFQRLLVSCGITLRSDPSRGIYASELRHIVQNERYPYIAPLALELISRAYRAAIFAPAGATTRDATFNSGFGLPGTNLAPWTYSAPRDVLPLQPAIPLSEVVARTQGIDSVHYNPFYLEDVADANSRVAEEAEIPRVKLSTSERQVHLEKYGRRIDITYEANRRIAIDLLAFNIQRIAITVEAEKLDKIVDILVNGDGSSGAATSYNLTTLDSGTTANNLTLKAYLKFRMKFKNPLAMTTILSQEDPLLSVMLLNSGSGNVPLVSAGPLFGAQQISIINQGLRDGVRGGQVDSAPSGKLVGFDSRFAVERLFEIGSNIQESDKDVKTQINTLVLSEVEGYDVIDPKAVKILNLAA